MKIIFFMATALVFLIIPMAAGQQAATSEGSGTSLKTGVKETAKTAGADLKEGGRAIVKGAKQAGRKTKESAKEVGKTAKEGFTHAGKEIKNTVKGKPAHTAPPDK